MRLSCIWNFMNAGMVFMKFQMLYVFFNHVMFLITSMCLRVCPFTFDRGHSGVNGACVNTKKISYACVPLKTALFLRRHPV